MLLHMSLPISAGHRSFRASFPSTTHQPTDQRPFGIACRRNDACPADRRRFFLFTLLLLLLFLVSVATSSRSFFFFFPSFVPLFLLFVRFKRRKFVEKAVQARLEIWWVSPDAWHRDRVLDRAAPVSNRVEIFFEGSTRRSLSRKLIGTASSVMQILRPYPWTSFRSLSDETVLYDFLYSRRSMKIFVKWKIQGESFEKN